MHCGAFWSFASWYDRQIMVKIQLRMSKGTSPVIRWLRICLRVCGTGGFDPWSGQIPHATGQLSPCAATTEPARHHKRSPQSLQLEKPHMKYSQKKRMSKGTQ